MKNSLFSILLILFSCFSFTSCTDKDQTPEPMGSDKYFFSCNMEGVSYLSEGFYAYASDFDTHINIYGASGLEIKDAIYLAMPKGFDVGTYDLDEDIYAIVAVGEASYSTLLSGGKGKVTIEAYDGSNIKGSFTFTAISFDDPADELLVTEGEFEVKLRE